MNHAQEALRVISTLPGGDTLDQAYAYAQVHATLALAEQQRISNLIALYDMGSTAPPSGIKSIDYAKIVADIAKALEGDPK